MTSLLRIDSSVTGTASVTNALNSLLVETLDAAATVVRRDATQLPSLSAEIFAANMAPLETRSPDESALGLLADELISELEQADAVVIGAPIYNFGVPSGIKAWMDLVARAGRTFTYTETGPQGLVTGKPAYIVSSSGGVALGSEADFATPHLRQFLSFIGFTDITVIDAGGLMMDPTKIEQAEAQIKQLALTATSVSS